MATSIIPTADTSFTALPLQYMAEHRASKSFLSRELLSRTTDLAALSALTVIDGSLHAVVAVAKLPFAATRLLLPRLLSDRYSFTEVGRHLNRTIQAIFTLLLDIPRIFFHPTTARMRYESRGLHHEPQTLQKLAARLWKDHQTEILVTAGVIATTAALAMVYLNLPVAEAMIPNADVQGSTSIPTNSTDPTATAGSEQRLPALVMPLVASMVCACVLVLIKFQQKQTLPLPNDTLEKEKTASLETEGTPGHPTANATQSFDLSNEPVKDKNSTENLPTVLNGSLPEENPILPITGPGSTDTEKESDSSSDLLNLSTPQKTSDLGNPPTSPPSSIPEPPPISPLTFDPPPLPPTPSTPTRQPTTWKDRQEQASINAMRQDVESIPSEVASPKVVISSSPEKPTASASQTSKLMEDYRLPKPPQMAHPQITDPKDLDRLKARGFWSAVTALTQEKGGWIPVLQQAATALDGLMAKVQRANREMDQPEQERAIHLGSQIQAMRARILSVVFEDCADTMKSFPYVLSNSLVIQYGQKYCALVRKQYPQQVAKALHNGTPISATPFSSGKKTVGFHPRPFIDEILQLQAKYDAPTTQKNAKELQEKIASLTHQKSGLQRKLTSAEAQLAPLQSGQTGYPQAKAEVEKHRTHIQQVAAKIDQANALLSTETDQLKKRAELIAHKTNLLKAGLGIPGHSVSIQDLAEKHLKSYNETDPTAFRASLGIPITRSQHSLQKPVPETQPLWQILQRRPIIQAESPSPTRTAGIGGATGALSPSDKAWLDEGVRPLQLDLSTGDLTDDEGGDFSDSKEKEGKSFASNTSSDWPQPHRRSTRGGRRRSRKTPPSSRKWKQKGTK